MILPPSTQCRSKADQQHDYAQERKYFDSGDYALSKAGKASDVGVTQMGTQHPLPENIPHLTSPGPNNNSTNGNGNGLSHGHGSMSQGGQAGSPVKEASFLHRETSIDDAVEDDKKAEKNEVDGSMSPPPIKEGVPIRWQH